MSERLRMLSILLVLVIAFFQLQTEGSATGDSGQAKESCRQNCQGRKNRTASGKKIMLHSKFNMLWKIKKYIKQEYIDQ